MESRKDEKLKDKRPKDEIELGRHPDWQTTAQTPPEAASRVSPHVYKFDTKGKHLNFIIVGCQGNAKESQKKVAELMKQIAEQPEGERPDFILFLGDNFYDSGVDSYDNEIFTSHFYDIYREIGLPCFVILGNHDYNFHKLNLEQFGKKKGIEVALRQVQHSYMPDNNYTIEDKVKLYQSENLDLKSLPLWNMPSRYYAIRNDSEQIFMLDTNTYVKDYLALIKAQEYLDFLLDINVNNPTQAQAAWLDNLEKIAKENGNLNPDLHDLLAKEMVKTQETLLPDNNQAAWLAEEMEIAKKDGLTIMFAQHNPLISPGKRAFHSDDGLYITEDEKKDLVNKLGITKAIKDITYGDLLLEIYKRQNFNIDAVFNAHDHSLYYYNNKPTPPKEPLLLIAINAITNNDVKTLKSCLEKGLDIDDYFTIGDDTYTLFHLALKQSKINAKIVELLKEHGANPNLPPAPYPVCQVGSGGGGGGLQEQLIFNKKLSFMKENGVWVVKCKKNHQLEFKMLTTSGKELTFNNLSHRPLQEYTFKRKNEKDEVLRLRQIVIEACEEYSKWLNEEQIKAKGGFLSSLSLNTIFSPPKNVSHGQEGVDRMNNILTYFKEEEACNLRTSLQILEELMEGSGEREHSLATILDKKLLQYCQFTMSAEEKKKYGFQSNLKELVQNPDLIYKDVEYYHLMIPSLEGNFAKKKDRKEYYIGNLKKSKNIDTIIDASIKHATADEIFKGYLDLCSAYPDSLVIANNYLKRVDRAFLKEEKAISSKDKKPLQEKKEEWTDKIKTMYCTIINSFLTNSEISLEQKKETTVEKLKETLTKRIIAAVKSGDINTAKKSLKDKLKDNPNKSVMVRIFNEMVNNIKNFQVEERQYNAYVKKQHSQPKIKIK